MPTTWTIAIDWNRNGSFTDTYDDVTSRAIDARWFLGTALQTGTVLFFGLNTESVYLTS